jgi:thymidylate synthase ThyX
MISEGHVCNDSLSRLAKLRAQRDEIAPNELRVRAREIELCERCWQQLRNVSPRTIAAIEAAEIGRRNANLSAADAERFDALNAEARRGATTRAVNFNPRVGEVISTVERERNEDDEWLLGKAATFPTLAAKGGG